MRRIHLILLASLGLNLFILGVWVGEFWRGPVPPFAPRPVDFAGLVQQRIDPASVAMIGERLDKLDEIMRFGFEARRQAFVRLREIIAREPYDQQAVEALLAELPAQRLASEETQWQLIAGVLARLPVEGRLAFADVVFAPPGLRPMPPPRGH